MKGKSHTEGIKQLQRGMRGHDEDQQKRGTSKNKAWQLFTSDERLCRDVLRKLGISF